MVDSEVLESRPVQNVSQALQGVVPGLNFSVNKTGGELNNNLEMDIRGGGTIGEGSKSAPLVLIDGIEGDMNSINPNDIKKYFCIERCFFIGYLWFPGCVWCCFDYNKRR